MEQTRKPVPKALRTWFLIHFLVDYAFAIPLFLSPQKYMDFMHWPIIDPVTGRLVASALFAIGGISLLARNASTEVYKALLKMKVIWSAGGIISLIIDSFNILLWSEVLLGSIFFVFLAVWVYYLDLLSKKPVEKIEEEIW